MTSLHGAIRNLLLADSTVTSLVSTRIYPLKKPLGAILPALTIHKISGPIDNTTGHGYPRYQISCWADSFDDVHDISAAVVDCLNGYKGVASGNHIKQIAYQNSQDAYEDKTGTYHIPIDFKVIHL